MIPVLTSTNAWKITSQGILSLHIAVDKNGHIGCMIRPKGIGISLVYIIRLCL